MVAPTFKKVTNPNPGNFAQYGSSDVLYAFNVLDGTHPTDRIQAEVIEGLHHQYHATATLEGSNFVSRNRFGVILRSESTTDPIGTKDVLQSALNQGGRIYIGPGTYNIADTLLVGSNTHVDADWNAIIRGRPSPNSHPLITNSNMTLGQSGGNNSYIIIEGGTWNGNSADTTVHGDIGNIHLEGVSFAWVNRVRSINSVSEGIKLRGNDRAWVTNCYVERSKLDSNGTGKAGIEAVAQSHDVIISNNIVFDSGGEAIGCATNCDRVHIVNNICKYEVQGQCNILVDGISTSNQHVRDVVITNNNVRSNFQCIHLNSCNGVVVAGNTLTNVGTIGSFAEGIRVAGISSNIIIRGNYIHDVRHHGMRFTNECTNLVITSNMIRRPAQAASSTYDGISFAISNPYNNVKISNNMIIDDRGTRLMRHGISYESVSGTGANTMDNHWVHHNQIYGQLVDAVRLWSGAGRFTGNTRFYSNSSFNPGDRITAPFNNTHSEIGLPAASTSFPATYAGTPEPSIGYTVVMSPIIVTSTGGTGVAITVEEPGSLLNMITNASTIRNVYLAPGFRITFGVFTAAPTVVVAPL